ncbi:MAG TPA: helix-turn-helix transcriptional regulator [Gemmatimonadaceae bacterium]|nr:helix-turn-helix transcriptional regulator [Gemmatimonadaceae bacterium]
MLRIGLRVRETRKAKGWSQEELADAAGVRRDTVSSIELDKTDSIEFDVLERLARALDVDPGYFFTRYCP